MADPFLGQIVLFGGNFAPRGWALCSGQLLSIDQNQALFSILGTTYGGDGRVTFALPDLRGRVAIHPGQGPGLNYNLGQRAGVENVTLNVNQLPSHTHPVTEAPNLEVVATTNDGNRPVPSATDRLAAAKLSLGQNVNLYGGATNTGLGGLQTSGTLTSQNTGGGRSHPNIQPYQVLNYIIALAGVFPSRN